MFTEVLALLIGLFAEAVNEPKAIELVTQLLGGGLKCTISWPYLELLFESDIADIIVCMSVPLACPKMTPPLVYTLFAYLNSIC